MSPVKLIIKRNCILITEKVSKKGSKATVIELTQEELNAVVKFDRMKEGMELALQTLQQEFREQLALRTNIGTYCLHVFK